MLDACLHLRRSTDDHQADSLATQEAGGRAWCERNGYRVVCVLLVVDGRTRGAWVLRAVAC